MAILVIATILTVLLSAGIIAVPVIITGRKTNTSTVEVDSGLSEELQAKDHALDQLMKNPEDFALPSQIEDVSSQITEVKVTIEGERNGLKAIEDKLEACQKEVEIKETHQQNIRTVREEDELKLAEVTERYQEITDESMVLEQQLATNLQGLDQIMGEVTLTAEQRAILQDMSNSLEATGGRVRDLIMEYESITNRLTSLKTQFGELEDEYTKLVEKHLV